MNINDGTDEKSHICVTNIMFPPQVSMNLKKEDTEGYA